MKFQKYVISLVLGVILLFSMMAELAGGRSIRLRSPLRNISIWKTPSTRMMLMMIFLKNPGQENFTRESVSKCHGVEGDGQGSAAEDIEIKPTALNAPGYMDDKSDGQLFWIMLVGSEGTEMEGFGPDSDTGLSEEKLWELVSYMRATFTN